MDPNAEFDRMMEAVKAEDWPTAKQHAETLRDWLKTGGYAPDRPHAGDWIVTVLLHGELVTVDDIITAVTEATTDAYAQQVIATVRSRAMLLSVADQLYIEDPAAHKSPWLRKAIVREARQ